MVRWFLSSTRNKKSLFNRGAEEARNLLVALWRLRQGRGLFRDAPIGPPRKHTKLRRSVAVRRRGRADAGHIADETKRLYQRQIDRVNAYARTKPPGHGAVERPQASAAIANPRCDSAAFEFSPSSLHHYRELV